MEAPWLTLNISCFPPTAIAVGSPNAEGENLLQEISGCGTSVLCQTQSEGFDTLKWLSEICDNDLH